jgi:hypothetical protein
MKDAANIEREEVATDRPLTRFGKRDGAVNAF